MTDHGNGASASASDNGPDVGFIRDVVTFFEATTRDWLAAVAACEVAVERACEGVREGVCAPSSTVVDVMSGLVQRAHEWIPDPGNYGLPSFTAELISGLTPVDQAHIIETMKTWIMDTRTNIDTLHRVARRWV
jgi:hypothetical protein